MECGYLSMEMAMQLLGRSRWGSLRLNWWALQVRLRWTAWKKDWAEGPWRQQLKRALLEGSGSRGSILAKGKGLWPVLLSWKGWSSPHCCQWGEEKLLLDVVALALLYMPCSWPPYHTGVFLCASSITVHSLWAGCGALELMILILVSTGMKGIGLWETAS